MLFTVDTSIGGTVLQDLPFRSFEATVSHLNSALAFQSEDQYQYRGGVDGSELCSIFKGPSDQIRSA
jgi:hypothetical protein